MHNNPRPCPLLIVLRAEPACITSHHIPHSEMWWLNSRNKQTNTPLGVLQLVAMQWQPLASITTSPLMLPIKVLNLFAKCRTSCESRVMPCVILSYEIHHLALSQSSLVFNNVGSFLSAATALPLIRQNVNYISSLILMVMLQMRLVLIFGYLLRVRVLDWTNLGFWSRLVETKRLTAMANKNRKKASFVLFLYLDSDEELFTTTTDDIGCIFRAEPKHKILFLQIMFMLVTK